MGWLDRPPRLAQRATSSRPGPAPTAAPRKAIMLAQAGWRRTPTLLVKAVELDPAEPRRPQLILIQFSSSPPLHVRQASTSSRAGGRRTRQARRRVSGGIARMHIAFNQNDNLAAERHRQGFLAKHPATAAAVRCSALLYQCRSAGLGRSILLKDRPPPSGFWRRCTDRPTAALSGSGSTVARGGAGANLATRRRRRAGAPPNAH